MKRTVDFYEFRKAFEEAGRGNNFSYEALETMFNYYEEMEEECEVELELDPVAFCCEWTEYTLDELYQDYSNLLSFEDWLDEDIYTKEDVDSGEAMDDFLDGDFLEEVERHTTVLKVTGANTYLVMAF
jgi:hypothetical protein